MFKINSFKWVPKRGFESTVVEAMSPAVRVKKEDVIKLPPVTYEYRETELSAEQSKAIRDIKRAGALMSESGSITAANAAVLLNKMQQICAGAVKDDSGGVVRYNCGARLSAVEEIIEQNNNKVVILASYTASIDLLVEQLSKRWTVDFIDGRVTGKARDDKLRAFRDSDDPHILVAQIKTLSHGVNLARANCIIYWGPTWSQDSYEQSTHRVMSADQKSDSIGIYHVYSAGFELSIYKSLREGVDLQQKVLALYKEATDGS
jgi:SNF2 family DNA or RNA helicase